MMQFACLSCRKVFKQPVSYSPTPKQRQRQRLCPECGKPLERTGMAFKAPRRSDLNGWRKVGMLVRNGFVFHRNTGSYPSSVSELRAYVNARRKRSKGARLAREIRIRETGRKLKN